MADVLTKAQRSYCMSQIRSTGTTPELFLIKSLRSKRLSFNTNVTSLAGRPDIVFTKRKIAIFVDGDFWHGWRFSRLQTRLSPKWKEKIAGNIARDRRNFARLRRQGWRVVRVWEHQIKKNPQLVVERVLSIIENHVPSESR
jgi:DNA mismatch endonuclease (patch repair protein)